MSEMLLTLCLICVIVALAFVQYSIRCLNKACQALSDAIEVHLKQHEHEFEPPDDWT